MRIFLLALFVLLLSESLVAQKINETYQIHIQRATSTIQIDGLVNEEAWNQAEAASDFYMVFTHGYKQSQSSDRCKDDLR
jgi:hypothetical protein